MFLTASHCTFTMLGLDTGTVTVRQGGSAIGTEYADPTVFTGGSCPAGRVCRWSDAALMSYTSGVSREMYRTLQANGAPNYTITDTVFEVGVFVSSFPFGLSGVTKTGYSTGTTYGSAWGGNACVNYAPDSATYAASFITIPGNLTLLCQGLSDYSAMSGDSGGSVYACDIALGNMVCLFMGVHHAGTPGTSVYSDLRVVENDVGPLRY